MKFVTGIIAALIASSEAYRIGNKKVDARKLMQSAVQLDPKTMRKLQNDNNNENGFQITNEHSIRFDSCTSLKTSSPNDETMFGDLIQYTKNGQIVAEKSYVVFSVCETATTCAYHSGDDPLFMVDLATYMTSMVDFMPQQHQEYCTACEGAQDYCQNGVDNQDAADQEDAQANDGQDQQAADGQQQQDGQQQDGAEQQQGGDQQANEGQQQDGGDQQQGEGQQGGADQAEGGQRRKLQNNNNNFEVIDCDVCEARNCFAAADDNQADNADGTVVVNDENIVAWVEAIAGCQQTASYWDAFPLYAGFICNGDGNGVEIGVFLDEECSIYTSQKAYKNVVGDDSKELFYNSQEIVTYPFLNSLSCGNQAQYITPDEYANMQANGENANNGENNGNGEASEMCRELMNGQAINLYDCNADGQEDQRENEIEEDQTAGYAWYSYTIAAADAEDNQAVCKILQTMEGEYTVVYNSNEKHGSGTFYDYSAKSGFQKRKGLFVTFIVLGVVAIVAGVYVVQSSKATKGKRGDSLLH